MADIQATPVHIGLNAVIVAVSDHSPQILCVPVADKTSSGAERADSLPFGPFNTARHRTFEASLRASVQEQTALHLGHVEQLYTFGDRGRHRPGEEDDIHRISVGYLALTRTGTEADDALRSAGARWRDWYDLFPWEDWRGGRPAMLDVVIAPRLAQWATGEETGGSAARRQARIRLAFGTNDFPRDEERVLDRYELLYEAGLVEESVSDGRVPGTGLSQPLGRAMAFDHRRIAATAMQRLRAKIKYRPVIFELMPPEFTLTELQTTVEAISGRHLHKQNFRRLVEGAALVEATGGTSAATGGRPAALYRFRSQILAERPAPGLRLGGRSAS